MGPAMRYPFHLSGLGWGSDRGLTLSYFIQGTFRGRHAIHSLSFTLRGHLLLPLVMVFICAFPWQGSKLGCLLGGRGEIRGMPLASPPSSERGGVWRIALTRLTFIARANYRLLTNGRVPLERCNAPAQRVRSRNLARPRHIPAQHQVAFRLRSVTEKYN